MRRESACGWCVHEDGPRWDAMLADGIPLAAVEALAPFSHEAAMAHVRDHTARHPVTFSSGMTVSTTEDLARHVVQLANQSVAMTEAAEQEGSTESMLRAVEYRAVMTTTLAAALGTDETTADGLLSECEALSRASVRLTQSGLPNDPETLAWLVRDAGGHRLAEAIEQ